MQLDIKSLQNKENVIDGVVLHPLTYHRDERGFLVETLKDTWKDVFERPVHQFGQSYCSMTMPGFARDEAEWHNHPTKQTDRFVVINGTAMFALYDWREGSKTKGVLNLFLMGEKNKDDNQFLLLIPQNVLHAFCCIGNESIYLLGFPDQVYDPSEEGRVPFQEVGAKLPDGTSFSWDVIRKEYNK